MKINQLSVFLENKPGRLSAACKALAEANINLFTLSLADTEQFGIMRIIVRDWQKAKEVLEQHANVVNVTEVVAIEVDDRPGGLEEVLQIMDAADINLEYMYAFTFRGQDQSKAILIFRFEDPDTAIKVMQDNNINVIASVDLFARAEE